MICPRCKRSQFFLTDRSWQSPAQCRKCGFSGQAEKPSYENYHQDLYSARRYRRIPETDPQMRQIFKVLQIQPNDVVIDLGCGVGDYTVQAAKHTSRAAGYDREVKEALKKYPGIQFFDHDFDKPIPLPDSSVDKLISINVIEHLLDWDMFLKECRRVLKPGGKIALSTANREFLLHDFHFDKTHLHEWTVREFQVLVEPYFKTISLKKDCAMFNYYPLNLLLRLFLKPDMTWIGMKLFK